MAISETPTTHSFQSSRKIFKFIISIDLIFNALYNDTSFIIVAQYLTKLSAFEIFFTTNFFLKSHLYAMTNNLWRHYRIRTQLVFVWLRNFPLAIDTWMRRAFAYIHLWCRFSSARSRRPNVKDRVACQKGGSRFTKVLNSLWRTLKLIMFYWENK